MSAVDDDLKPARAQTWIQAPVQPHALKVFTHGVTPDIQVDHCVLRSLTRTLPAGVASQRGVDGAHW